MRQYALTYPQLVGQAGARGVAAEGLARIRQVYEFAEGMADGLYRPQGQPFLNHLVRTASIMLAEEQPLPATLAAMVHSSYELHRFAASRRLRASYRRRAEVAAAVGDDVEVLVWAYHTTPWQWDELEDYVREVSEYDGVTRQVRLMRTANDFEDLLDGAPLLSVAPMPPANLLAALARELGQDRLALEIAEAAAACQAAAVPNGVVRDRDLTYELPRHHAWERRRRDSAFQWLRAHLGLVRRALRSALGRRV
jgi:hypothetical protein